MNLKDVENFRIGADSDFESLENFRIGAVSDRFTGADRIQVQNDNELFTTADLILKAFTDSSLNVDGFSNIGRFVSTVVALSHSP